MQQPRQTKSFWCATCKVAFERQVRAGDKVTHNVCGTTMLDLGSDAEGRRRATASGTAARVCDVATGTEISVVRGHAFAVSSLALTPAGELLATGS